MIIEPDLLTHWKFQSLSNTLGRLEALEALIGLWGHCQTRRQWIFRLTPRSLVGICRFSGDADLLWKAMTDEEAGWLTLRPDGAWEVRGWVEQNRAIIVRWFARTGGRAAWMDEFPLDESTAAALPSAMQITLPPPISDPGGSADASADRSTDASPDPSMRREEMRREKSTP